MKKFLFCIFFLQTVLSQSSPEDSSTTESSKVSSQTSTESAPSAEPSKCNKWICLNEAFGAKFQTRNSAIEELKSTISPDPWKALVEDVVDICFDNNTVRASYEKNCDNDFYYCIIEKLSENCPERYIRDGAICSPIECENDIKTSMCKQRRIRLNPNLSANIKEEYNRKCCFLGVIFNPAVMARCGVVSELYQKKVRIHAPSHNPINATLPSETDEKYYIRTIALTQDYGVTSTFSSDSNSPARKNGVAIYVPSDNVEHIYRNSLDYDYSLHSQVAFESDGYPVNRNANVTSLYKDRHIFRVAAENGSIKRLTAEIPLIMMTIRSLLVVYVMK